MKQPIAITFRGISSSQWIEDDIRKRASKLDVYCHEVVSCHVVVDRPHRHHAGGNRFSLRIDLTVPGGEIAVTRGSNLDTSRNDLGLVIHEAFDVAARKLRDYVRKRRHAVKLHERPAAGRLRIRDAEVSRSA